MASLSRLFFIAIAALMVIPGGCSKKSAVTGEDGDGSGTLTEGAPIDLPVPIAKGIDGVDPTTVRLVEGSSNANSRVPAERQDSGDIIGALSFQLINTSSDRLVALVSSQKIVDSTITSGGAGSFVLTSDLIANPLALVAAGENTTADNSGPWSPPIVVTIYLDELNIISGNYFIIVSITNTDKEMTAVTTAADIGVHYAVPSSGDSITFVATDSSDAPFVGSIPLTGGDMTVFSAEPPHLLAGIEYDADGILTGWDDETGVIYRLDSSGGIIYTESSSLIPEASSRHFSFSPDNRWMAVNRLLSDGSFGLTFIDLNNTAQEIVPTLQGLSVPADNLSFDWRDNSNLLAFPPIELGTLYNLAVSEILSGTTTALTPTAVFDGEFTGIRPVYNSSRNEVVYDCYNPALGISHLCLYAFDTGVGDVIFSQPDFFVVLPRLAPDGSYVVFSGLVEHSPADIALDPIGLYVFDSGETVFLGEGARPVPSSTDPDIIVYGTCDTTGDGECGDNDAGGLQISVFNLENLGIDL